MKPVRPSTTVRLRGARPLVERPGASFTWPRVSPDGTKVVYGHGGKVEWVDIESGEVSRTEEFSEEPAWYGNETLIA